MPSTKTNVDFKELFRSAPALFLLLKPDANFTIIDASEQYLQATLRTREQLVGLGIFEAFPDNPNDTAADGVSNLRKSLETVVREKKPHTMALQRYDVEIPGSAGEFEEKYWQPHNSPVLSEDGELQCIIHRVEDVSDLIRERKKNDQERELALSVLDEKLQFINLNKKRIDNILEILLKYTVMDFSKSMEISDKSDEIDAIAMGLNTLSEELVYMHETEEKRMKEIQKINEFLDTILENLPNMVFVKDAAELRFVRFNKAGEKLLGLPRAELMGKNDYDFFPKEQADFFTAKDREALALNDVTDIPEEEIKTAMGPKWLHTRKIPILGHDGKPAFLLGISEDITARKSSEENVLRLNEELSLGVRQLQSVNKELEAFSYSVSHDLRAPLRAVSGYAQMMTEDYGTKLDEEGIRILDAIKFNAARMGTLIDDLLSFSRLGRKDIQRTEVDMNDLVEGVMIDMDKVMKHNAEIKIDKLPKVRADYGLLHQVVYNLVANAVKYSSKKDKPVVEVSAKEDKNEIIFSIKDNGAGFNMDYASKLFGVFQRLHSQEEFEGTGVGLAIVQRIINKHGGRVWAEGQVNKGATFYFSLTKN